ncbi:acyl-CoA thioesterase [Haladaptatus sp. DJG-WS-42]|uniref:acyl-CoA thioesterase n=1 Tax=Haladaptatus sp. DJG-WS-42 TaxID=3120516 RepID=UPI0030CF7573
MPSLMETYIENRELILPNHTNTYEIAHGGNVMKWMDEVGAMSAMRFAGETCVTARMDQVNFHRPIPLGETALIRAYVYKAGRTSVRVRLRAYREDPLTGDTELTTESFFVYVAIDDHHKPTEVPDLEAATTDGQRLLDEALNAEAEMNGRA